MRKVDVVRPAINYAVVPTTGRLKGEQIAWFVNADDATDFLTSQGVEIAYEVAEVRR
jgi:hypothetical protein